MKLHTESFIHELNSEEIIEAIENNKWGTSKQTISSSETNNNNLIEPDEKLLSEKENTAGFLGG